MEQVQLAAICDALAHYHTEHTKDMITRIRGKGVDIYVVSEPEWRSRVAECVAPAFDTKFTLGHGRKEVKS